MLIPITRPLFAWDRLEDSPSLATVRNLLAAIPDAKLLQSLRQSRGKGRDDYPVHVLWCVHLLKIILRHATTEACWFGYKLHLLVDVKHEVALAYEITDTKAGDGETLATLLARAQANLPPQRVRTLAYDKAADTNGVHELLSRHHIRAVIQNRSLWKEEPERMLPGHDGNSNIVYDEAGTVYCYDRVSLPIVRHRMAYIGYEPSRETIKYRCPARHEGWSCPMSEICNAGKSYGKTVRVPREIDLRRFPAIPRATKQFERLYNGRTAVERVNGRLKIFWGVDDGNLRGARRFVANVGAVMVVHAAFATVLASTPRREGSTLGQMKLSPIAKTLQPRGPSKASAPTPAS